MNFKTIRNLVIAIILAGLLGISLYKSEILKYEKVNDLEKESRSLLSTWYNKANYILITLTLDEKIDYLLLEEGNNQEYINNIKSSINIGLVTEDEIDKLVLNIISWKIFNELMI